jgi:hypothetical protein
MIVPPISHASASIIPTPNPSTINHQTNQNTDHQIIKHTSGIVEASPASVPVRTSKY